VTAGAIGTGAGSGGRGQGTERATRADPAPGGSSDPAPGVRDQLGSTIAAGRHLVGAHVELAKAELGEGLDELKRLLGLVAVALAAGFVLGVLLVVGLLLFLGETLFGSLGWGVLHGTLLLTGIALAGPVAAAHLGGIGTRLIAGIVVGLVVAVVAQVVVRFDVVNGAWAGIGNATAGALVAEARPFAAGAAVMAIVGAVVGLLLGAIAGGGRGALLGLVGGAIGGALFGALSASALGLTVALLVWIVLLLWRLRAVDPEALRARIWPDETIETTKETIEWVRAQTPLARKS
jgi:MFS family permease